MNEETQLREERGKALGDTAIALLKASLLHFGMDLVEIRRNRIPHEVIMEFGKTLYQMAKDVIDVFREFEMVREFKDGGWKLSLEGSVDGAKHSVGIAGKGGNLKYITLDGDYVYSGGERVSPPDIPRMVMIIDILHSQLRSIEAHIGEYEKLKEEHSRLVDERVVSESKEMAKDADAMARALGHKIADAFGYEKGKSKIYSAKLDIDGEKINLEIKIFGGFTKYIRLNGEYIVSEYGYSKLDDYVRLIKVLRRVFEVEAEKSKKGEMAIIYGDTAELDKTAREIKEMRKLVDGRLKELAVKIAVWFGKEVSAGAYLYEGEANGHTIKIRTDGADVKYLVVDGRYIVSSYEEKPYLEWLIKAHKILYEHLGYAQKKISVEIDEAKIDRGIPDTIEVEEVVELPDDFELEEARIILPQSVMKGDEIERKVVVWKDGSKEVWNNYTMKEVKVRKPHRCDACGRMIEKGETALTIVKKTKRGNRYSVYYCSDEYEIREEKIKIKPPEQVKKKGVGIEL